MRALDFMLEWVEYEFKSGQLSLTQVTTLFDTEIQSTFTTDDEIKDDSKQHSTGYAEGMMS